MSGTQYFGQLLRQHRKYAGLTQSSLADRIGYSVWTIRKLEAGALRPSQNITAALSEALALDESEREEFVVSVTKLGTDHQQLDGIEQQTGILSLPQLPPTSFVGRERDVARVRTLLLRPSTRVLTLVGVGGIGKTRLALHVATELEHAFEDGVAFLNLLHCTDGGQVAPAVFRVLGLPDNSNGLPPDTLSRRLRRWHRLLVVDNAERVIDSVALVTQLLVETSRLTIIITSRVAPSISFGSVYEVPPLTVPSAEHSFDPDLVNTIPAVRLFRERAQVVNIDFELTPTNSREVMQLCRALDGIPLAIELAAARMTILTPAQLLGTRHNLFDLLATTAVDIPAYHQTLRATIDWSFFLLDHPAQQLFLQLAVFAAGWTLDAAEAVCLSSVSNSCPIVDGLELLLRCSLITRVDGPHGVPWFRMLEPIREYALEKQCEIVEVGQLRGRHMEYILGLCERSNRTDDPRWLVELSWYQPNICAALRCAIDQEDASTALRMAHAVTGFWIHVGFLKEASKLLHQALAIKKAVSPDIRAKALGSAGGIAWRRGCFDEASELLAESLALFRQIGDLHNTAWLAMNLSKALLEQGDLVQATTLADEATAIFNSLKFTYGSAWAMLYEGEVAFSCGNVSGAEVNFSSSLSLFRDLDHLLGQAWALARQGHVALIDADNSRAAECFRQALHMFHKYGDKPGIVCALEGIAGVLSMTSDDEATAIDSMQLAIQLLAASEALRDVMSIPVPPIELNLYHAALERVRSRVEETAFTRAWMTGKQFSLDHTVYLALKGTMCDS